MSMVKTYQLTLTAAAQRLSDVYGDGANVAKPANDIPYRQITLQAASAAAHVGSDGTTLSTSIYGYKIPTDGSLTLGPFETGPVKLSDLYVLGASCVLHVTGVPY